ncbi:MAG TPA: phosphoglycerate kinase, partial [Candidatus Paceibacterota bacterium]|nr:phosphoglycerate kinase [Candidatus Paceibacterota bacterium]
DFDVPVVAGKIQELFRIQKQKETIDFLLEHKVHIMMIAHISAVDSFRNLLPQLEEILGRRIFFVEQIEDIPKLFESDDDHQLALLDNVRLWSGEQENAGDFAGILANGFDFYVNNAFAVCHRKHASVAAIAQFLPAYAGFLIQKEVTELQKVMDAPSDGKIIILGGAKASTKIPVIQNFITKAEVILIGGVIANDILLAKGEDIGSSVVDPDADVLLQGLDLASEKLILPTDFIIEGDKYLDIGDNSIQRFLELIQTAKIIIWNGPMGVAEDSRFAQGTQAIAQTIVDSSALRVVGGGDTIAAIHRLDLLDKFNFVSTGGGAMLSFLAGERLPGLEVLNYYG